MNGSWSRCVPAGRGKSLAGQLCRIVVVEGAQVADFNAWNLNNPRERFWAARTKQLHRAHVSTFDRPWSCLPDLRPMLTITGDTVEYPLDEDGRRGAMTFAGPAAIHTFTDCSTARTSITAAIQTWCGRLPRTISMRLMSTMCFNIFQVTGLTREDRYFVKPSPAKQGDFFEFFAQIDLLCAISTCPHGDLSVQVWGEDAGDPIDTCHPLGVEVFQPRQELLEGWESPSIVDFRGIHGLDHR